MDPHPIPEPTDPRETLIGKLDAAREILLKALAQLTQDEEIYPRWKLKHFLAHVTGWDEAITASLRAYVEGESAALASYRGIDEYNARSVETRIDLSLPQIEREWAFAREELKAAIRGIPLDRYPGELVFPWGERGPADGLVHVLIYHEKQHAAELEEHKIHDHGEPPKVEAAAPGAEQPAVEEKTADSKADINPS